MLKKPKEPSVDDLMAAIISEMETYGSDAPEYPQLLDKLERLAKVKRKNARPKVTPDGLIAAFANLAGIAVIVFIERNGVFTSKAQQFFKRP